MSLLSIFPRFPDQEACIEHLENLYFGDASYCPHCGGVKVTRKADSGRIRHWNYHDGRSG